MSGIISRIGILFIKFFSLLPLGVLYIISDILFFFVFYIIGYRKDVVFKNLRNSFPEKNSQELQEIAKKFYSHFCDLLLETIKYFSPEKDRWKKQVDLTEVSELNKYFDEGKSVIVLSFHYGNWEWAKFVSPLSKHISLSVYNPQRNQVFDTYFNNLRLKFVGKLVSTGRIYKELLKYQEQNKKTLTWLAADQTPTRTKFWTMFLNQETPFFPGPGRLVKKTNQPVLLQYMEKTGRGKYKCIVEPLIDDTSKYSEHEILGLYANRIEQVIREKPQYYLWSHRRWKHQRPEEVPLFQK